MPWTSAGSAEEASCCELPDRPGITASCRPPPLCIAGRAWSSTGHTTPVSSGRRTPGLRHEAEPRCASVGTLKKQRWALEEPEAAGNHGLRKDRVNRLPKTAKR